VTKDERKEKIVEMNKKAIIDAAEALIAQNNYDYQKVTMNDIAEKADFTKRTVYQYFGSKEALQFEIMIRGHEYMIKRLNAVISDAQTGMIRLKSIAKALYQYSHEDPLHFWMVMSYENQNADFEVSEDLIQKTYELGEVSMKILIDTIALGVSDGSMSKDLDVKQTAFAVWSFLLGILQTEKLKKNYMKHMHQIDVDKWVDDALDLIYQTLQRG